MTYTKWDTAPLMDHNVGKTYKVLCGGIKRILELPAGATAGAYYLTIIDVLSKEQIYALWQH